MSKLPSFVKIVEVGPRDGLQNEAFIPSTECKVDLINRLAGTGLKVIESGSFVSPKWVPAMADSAEVFNRIDRRPGVAYTALTPNLRGMEAALAANVDEVAVFIAASERFSQKNTNCTVAEALQRCEPIFELANKNSIPVRGYISCVLGCPYEGRVNSIAVATIAKRLLDMGCYEISLGDTIGVGTPLKTAQLIEEVSKCVPRGNVAVHFHNTYGQALANIYSALQCGINVFDSSIAGLGGCPFAKGATGNVATEDVVYCLQEMNIETGIDLDKLVVIGNDISELLQRRNQSMAGLALNARRILN